MTDIETLAAEWEAAIAPGPWALEHVRVRAETVRIILDELRRLKEERDGARAVERMAYADVQAISRALGEDGARTYSMHDHIHRDLIPAIERGDQCVRELAKLLRAANAELLRDALAADSAEDKIDSAGGTE